MSKIQQRLFSCATLITLSYSSLIYVCWFIYVCWLQQIATKLFLFICCFMHFFRYTFVLRFSLFDVYISGVIAIFHHFKLLLFCHFVQQMHRHFIRVLANHFWIQLPIYFTEKPSWSIIILFRWERRLTIYDQRFPLWLAILGKGHSSFWINHGESDLNHCYLITAESWELEQMVGAFVDKKQLVCSLF